MQRYLQYCVAGGLLLLGSLALFSGVLSPPADGAPAPDQPRVEMATHKPYAETIPDSKVKFDLVPIPGGSFLMGSPATEKGRSDEEGPQHPVAIRPFWMGKLEVSWDEYDLYWKDEKIPRGEKSGSDDGVRDGDAITHPTSPYADETFGMGREGYPVIGITHHAAMQYCRWLSRRTGKTYRLPTEAEWEWAARAGTTGPYFFGDDPKKLGDYAWYGANAEEITHPVGQKKPNPWGLHDIYGNVTEWCVDQYKKDAYREFALDKPALGPVLLPKVATRFPDVARGGSWADNADRCRSATRRGSDKTWIKLDPQRPQSIWWLTSAEFVGFRVVRPVEEQDNLKGIRSRVGRESD